MKELIILGTRPEAIKLIPIIQKLKQSNRSIVIVSTQQHPDAIEQIFNEHGIKIDYKLTNMNHQFLHDQLAHYLKELTPLLKNSTFRYILTQGDTISAYAGMLFAYLNKIDFLYVEAGLRTHDLMNPFPEEGLRVMMSHIAKMNFAPTLKEQEYLLNENVDPKKVYVVGNTCIDYIRSHIDNISIEPKINTILLTIHRRENWQFLEDFFETIKSFAVQNPSVTILYPMHFNPTIQELAKRTFLGISNITLTTPLSSTEFYRHLLSADLVITDSGGVQEEASFLKKKMIVLRDKTERTYFNEYSSRISINDSTIIEEISAMLRLPNNQIGYDDIYGDGQSSNRIFEWIQKEYKL